MNPKEAAKLLREAQRHRLYGHYPEALAILHRLNTEFPKEIKYLGLLASTYWAAGERETSEEYCYKALELDPDCALIYEMLGIIAQDKKDIPLAKQHYSKAIELNPQFAQARLRLMRIYYEEKNYEEVKVEGLYLVTHNNITNGDYTPREQREIWSGWLSVAYFKLWESFILTEEYRKAAFYIQEYIEIAKPSIKDPYFFFREDTLLFKLYYLLKDKEKLEEYRSRWLNHYKASQYTINGMEQDVEQGYILNMNTKNYKLDERGRFL